MIRIRSGPEDQVNAKNIQGKALSLRSMRGLCRHRFRASPPGQGTLLGAVPAVRGRRGFFVFADFGQQSVYPAINFAAERPFPVQGFREHPVLFPHLDNGAGGSADLRVFFAQFLILPQQVANPAFETIKKFHVSIHSLKRV